MNTTTNFSATTQNGGVNIKWTVANETNMTNHIVEKSINGANWSTIANVLARNLNNTDNYSSFDNTPSPCKNYYRLKSIENTGKVSYSNVALIQYNCKDAVVTVYPNPANNTVNISVPSTFGKYNMRLLNSAGQLLQNENSINTSTYQVNISKLPTGIYMIQLTDKNNNTSTQKLIIQH